MPAKRTHEQFVELLKIKQPNLVVLSNYISSTDYVTVKCTIHDYTFESKPIWLLKNPPAGCQKCYDDRRGVTLVVGVYEIKFKQLQAKYNQFWSDGSMSLAMFYSIEQETEQAKDEFEGKQRNIMFAIDNSKEKFYYDNLEYYKEVEDKMESLGKRIDNFSNMVDRAVEALRVIDEVEYSVAMF